MKSTEQIWLFSKEISGAKYCLYVMRLDLIEVYNYFVKRFWKEIVR
jgi:hypothetical protein